MQDRLKQKKVETYRKYVQLFSNSKENPQHLYIFFCPQLLADQLWINGVDGFFILGSSLDAEPEAILKL